MVGMNEGGGWENEQGRDEEERERRDANRLLKCMEDRKMRRGESKC